MNFYVRYEKTKHNWVKVIITLSKSPEKSLTYALQTFYNQFIIWNNKNKVHRFLVRYSFSFFIIIILTFKLPIEKGFFFMLEVQNFSKQTGSWETPTPHEYDTMVSLINDSMTFTKWTVHAL